MRSLYKYGILILLIILVGTALAFFNNTNKNKLSLSSRASSTSALEISDDLSVLTSQLKTGSESFQSNTNKQSLQALQSKSLVQNIARKRKDLIQKKLEAGEVSTVIDNLYTPTQAESIAKTVSDTSLVESYSIKEGTIYHSHGHLNWGNGTMGKSTDSYQLGENGKPYNTKVPLYTDMYTLDTGNYVRANMAALSGSLILSKEKSAVVTSDPKAGVASVTGTIPVAIIPVRFKNRPESPFSLDQLNKAVFTDASSAKNFYSENSDKHVTLSGKVFDWVTAPFDDNLCRSMGTGMLPAYLQPVLQQKNIDLTPYRFHIYVFNGCGLQGFAEIGGAPSLAEIYIYSQQPTKTITAMIDHELGHNFGIHHSNAADCPNGNLFAQCTSREYGDIYTIMGDFWQTLTNPLHITAMQKSILGWIPPTKPITGSGTYFLGPNESATSLARSYSIPNPAGDNSFYFEYKQPIGYDRYLTTFAPNVLTGMRMFGWSGLSSWQPDLFNMHYSENKHESFSDTQSIKIVDPYFHKDISISQLSHSSSSTSFSVSIAPGTGPGSLNSWNENLITPFSSFDNQTYIGDGFKNTIIIGHAGASADTREVYTATLSDTGTLSPWEKQANSLPITSDSFNLQMKINADPPWAYLFDSGNSTVWNSPVNPDGKPGEWKQIQWNSHPGSAYSLTASNGMLILSGGFDRNYKLTDTVSIYSVASDGTFSGNSTVRLPMALRDHVMIGYGNWLYVIGGHNGSGDITSIYRTELRADRSISGWTLLPQKLPFQIHSFSGSVLNGRLYILGGLNAEEGYSNSVISIPINSQGDLGTWEREPYLPLPMRGARSFSTSNNYLTTFRSKDLKTFNTLYAAHYAQPVPTTAPLNTTTITPTPKLPTPPSVPWDLAVQMTCSATPVRGFYSFNANVTASNNGPQIIQYPWKTRVEGSFYIDGAGPYKFTFTNITNGYLEANQANTFWTIDNFAPGTTSKAFFTAGAYNPGQVVKASVQISYANGSSMSTADLNQNNNSATCTTTLK